MKREVKGRASLPLFGKFMVFLECGHKLVCDWSVDRELPDEMFCNVCDKQRKSRNIDD